MEKKENRYEELLMIIKEHPPILRNPEKLTDGIMDRIDKLAQPRHTRHTHNRWLLVAGWLSTMAATILICLFVSETFTARGNKAIETLGSLSGSLPTYTPEPWQTLGLTIEEIQRMSPEEKCKYLQPLIKERRESRAKRRQTKAGIVRQINQ